MDERWIIVIVVFIVVLQFYIYRQTLKRKEAIQEVLKKTDKEKIEEINSVLDDYGFYFEYYGDIVSSKMNCWQRKMGYCKLYDDLAPSLNMVIDCEPIYFYYDNRRWLIEFWKGQYGMTTGGEVGIYVTDKKDIDIPGIFSGSFYECVTDEERLNMRFTLTKKENMLFKRKDYHWWLTGFDVGVFSKPSNLSMDIKLTFPNFEMKKAFIDGLERAGYKEDEYRSVNNVIYIKFDTPKFKNSKGGYIVVLPFIQLMNWTYCNLYNWLTRDFERTLDKIYFLCIYYPTLFTIISRKKQAEKIQEIYKSIQLYLNEDEKYKYKN